MRRLRVLESFPTPRSTTNPYLVLLARSIAESGEADVLNFTWRAALLRRYDVFHVHWPEILVDGRTPARKGLRQLLFIVLLVRLRLTRTPLVRTIHNVELPSGISRREIGLLRLAERLTTLRIILNDFTPLPAGAPHELIVHGHYRDWFAQYEEPKSLPGRVTYFGLIRRYKGVEELLDAFRDIPASAELTMVVAGKPSSSDLVEQVVGRAAGDDRISLVLRFLTDEELVSHVGTSELVVLPYRFMHNSGGVLAALSLDRPVLIPANDVNEALKAEVGDEWVYTFKDGLHSSDIIEALVDVRARDRGEHPDLDAREWKPIGMQHVQAFRRAIGIRKGGTPLRDD